MGIFDKMKQSFQKPLPKPKPINIPKPRPLNIPKPKIDMNALQKSTEYIAGIISVHPVGKLLVAGTLGIADLSTHGAATKYVNHGQKTNQTISLIPGGMLLQSILGDSTAGKSNQLISNKVPDPKRDLFQLVAKKSNSTLQRRSDSQPKPSLLPVETDNSIKNTLSSKVLTPTYSSETKIQNTLDKKPVDAPVEIPVKFTPTELLIIKPKPILPVADLVTTLSKNASSNLVEMKTTDTVVESKSQQIPVEYMIAASIAVLILFLK